MSLPPVITEVMFERIQQDEKWGEQNHDDMTWITVLTEEVGEAAQASLSLAFGNQTGLNLQRQRANLRSELIQVAAVAVAHVEAIDRRDQQQT